jgi:hypothetical protein
MGILDRQSKSTISTTKSPLSLLCQQNSTLQSLVSNFSD